MTPQQNLGYILAWIPDKVIECQGVWQFGVGGIGTIEDYVQAQAENDVELYDGDPYDSGAVPLYDEDDNLVAVWVPMNVAPATVRDEIAESEDCNVEWATYFVDTTDGEFDEDTIEGDNGPGHQDLAAQEDGAYNYE